MSPSGGIRTPMDQAPGTSEHMAGNDTQYSTLTYAYDDSLLETPLDPMAADTGPPVSRRHSAAAIRAADLRLLRWLIQHRSRPVTGLSHGLLFLASVDRDQIGSRGERYRYHTIALLMLLAGLQALYSATLFMSMSLGKPMRSEMLVWPCLCAARHLHRPGRSLAMRRKSGWTR